MTTLQVPLRILELCARGADAQSPLENGGIFIGRSEGAVGHVEHMIGAGPNARHAHRWLEVDDEWQNLQIRRFADAGANVAYLGEWHSHPVAADATPSRTDRRTLHLLANDPSLGCPNPVMMILFPNRGGWDHGAWQVDHGRRRLIPFGAHHVTRADVMVAPS